MRHISFRAARFTEFFLRFAPFGVELHNRSLRPRRAGRNTEAVVFTGPELRYLTAVALAASVLTGEFRRWGQRR